MSITIIGNRIVAVRIGPPPRFSVIFTEYPEAFILPKTHARLPATSGRRHFMARRYVIVIFGCGKWKILLKDPEHRLY